MTKLVKPHPPSTPPRTNSHTNEFRESEDSKEPKESKAVAFPTSNTASPSSTPSKPSKFRRFSKLSTSSASSDDTPEVHDALRLRKPSLLKTVKRVSSKQLRSISSTLTNSAHRITLHGHGHRIEHSSESSDSSQSSEPSYLSQSFDSSHLANSSHSSESSELSQVAESEAPSQDSRRRRVSLPSFRLLRPSSYSRSRTGSSVGSAPSVAPPIPTIPANLDIGFGRSYSSSSISTAHNDSSVLSPVLASPSSTATPNLPSPMVVSGASSADGDAKDSRDTLLAVGDDLYHETDAQETQSHPPGLSISVELVQTSEAVDVEPAAQMPSGDQSVLGETRIPPATPLPSSSRSVSSISSFSYTLPPSASPDYHSWTDDIDVDEDSEDEGEDEYENDAGSDEDINDKSIVKVDPHRVSKGPFISSIFILVPVLSVRRPIGFYLNWWLGRNSGC
ncbi:hypothetical protein F5050DRAFT_1734296 [Lentinula boryana]|uniref:Uncharacterized protein n=1 Tax=Lentinula boryana TaxID=40481 RepID=A0ABQ8QMN6_9AGAR|nr:hypothetical protein F5050DRAFT_1734296 [Lentinula boryana]